MSNIKPKILICANQLGYIGKDGDLMYRIKADMNRFKRLTTNNIVIMGRKTLESLPKGEPLKNRINYVITNNYNLLKNEHTFDNLVYVNSLDEALIKASEYKDKIPFIIGGSQIYQKTIDRGLYDTIYLTLVKDKKIGDVKIKLNFFDVIPAVSEPFFYKEGDNYYKYITLINNK